MSNKEIKNEHKTPNDIGKCSCCEITVFDNQLYVEPEEKLYHFSCHNRKVQKDNEIKSEQ